MITNAEILVALRERGVDNDIVDLVARKLARAAGDAWKAPSIAPVDIPQSVSGRQLLDTQQAAKVSGYSVAHFRYLAKQGVAPAPVRLSARKLGWRVSDLNRWVDEAKNGLR